MTLAVAWIVLPIVLALLSLGCGLLLEAASGMRIPGTLLLPGGFIVISLATQFAHMSDLTAPLQTPLVLVLSLAGYGISRPWRRFQLDRWLGGAAAGVYAVFAAPVVLSGQATFLGYIKLDDTALYQAMLDRAATHAYDIAGLPQATYESALLKGYQAGYPLGSLLPLDVGHTLLTIDTLWLWQPYLAFMAVLTALGLYELASGLVRSRALRACVAFFGTQAALMYGYFLWGGVKEMFVPGVLLFAICLVPRVRAGGPRQVIPLAAASAAVIGGLSVGGGVWIVPMIVAGLVLLVMTRPVDAILSSVVVYVVLAPFLAIPMLSVSATRLSHLHKFLKGGETGQLPHPLGWVQLFGPWFSGDFRYGTTQPAITDFLAVLVGLAAVGAAVVAWRRARWEVIVALATALFACLIYVERASPWVAGKALAASSPLVLGVALIGVAIAVESRRQVEGGVALAVLAAIGAGVLWANGIQYHAVSLAPSSRLMELETIGHKFSGQGPALLTEFEPYAARHFLRGMAAETPSELRAHYVYLRGCHQCYAGKGVSPDIDEIRLDQVLIYHTLIIRRTAVASRPPSVYTLRWSGRYYDVWQRSGPPNIIKHFSLGSRFQPAGVPDCAEVMHLASLAAAAHGSLATVYRPPVIEIEPSSGRIGVPKLIPNYYGEPVGLLKGSEPYKVTYSFTVPSAGKYGIWVGGSFNSTVTVKVDGNEVGQQSNQAEWPGNFLSFGSVTLSKGPHKLRIKHDGPDLGPGSAAAQPFGLGPFVIAQGTDDLPVAKVPTDRAHSLCGKSLDWVEALRG